MKIRLNSIQMLRGFAAIAVMLLHTSDHINSFFKKRFAWDFFSVGWSGVDIFFVLSGFIITYIHFEDLQRKSNVQSFFKKRFNRIFPIFWVILFIYGLLSILTTKSISHEFIFNFIRNFFLIDAPATERIIVVSWSLTYEVIFYLIFGGCILLGMGKSKIVWISWFVLIIAANLFFVSQPILLNGFILEFLFGVVVGYIFKEVTLSEQKYAWGQRNYGTILVTGIILFIIAWMLSLSGEHQYFKKTSLESRFSFGIGASLMIFGLAMLDLKKNIRIPSFLILLGDASYVLYLLHPLCLALCFRVSSKLT